MHKLTDQDDSLARSLVKAGVQHGDTTNVSMFVGVQRHGNRSQLCFCSAQHVEASLITPGTAEDRRKPMPEFARLSRSTRKAIAQLHGQHGCAKINFRLVSNGTLRIQQLEIDNFHQIHQHIQVNEKGALIPHLKRRGLIPPSADLPSTRFNMMG